MKVEGKVLAALIRVDHSAQLAHFGAIAPGSFTDDGLSDVQPISKRRNTSDRDRYALAELLFDEG